MKTSRSPFIPLMLVAALAAPARADIDPKLIPADSSCVMHVDISRLMKSAFGRRLVATMPADAARAGREGRETFGINPYEDVTTMTIIQGPSGKAGDKPVTAYLITGRFDSATFVAAVKKHGGETHASEAYQGHTIHAFPAMAKAAPEVVAPKRSAAHDSQQEPGLAVGVGPAGASCVTVYRPDTLVAATTTAHLKRTLDVLDGRSPGMTAEQAAAFLPARQDGTYFTLASTDHGFSAFRTTWVAEEGEPPAFGIRHLGVTLGEVGGDVLLSGRAKTPNAEGAARLKSMVDGMRTIMALTTEQGDPKDKLAAAFGDALAKAQCAVDQEMFTASVRLPAEAFIGLFVFEKDDEAERAAAANGRPDGARPEGK